MILRPNNQNIELGRWFANDYVYKLYIVMDGFTRRPPFASYLLAIMLILSY
jgi:hypothetical protein